MLNKVLMIGNLTRDVELRYTGSGSAVAKFGLASNRTWKDRNTGEKREEVCFVDVNIFGKSAETANKYLEKGKSVLIEGRLVLEQWQDQNGQKRSKHSIAAESFQFIGGKGDGQNSQHEEQKRNGYQPQNDHNTNNAPQENRGSIDIDDDQSIPF